MSFAALLAAADRAATGILGGVSIRYAPSALAGELYVDVQGMFNLPDLRVQVGEAGVQSVSPSVFVHLADLAPFNPDEDDDPTVTVNGTTYSVGNIDKDGLGGATLQLLERD